MPALATSALDIRTDALKPIITTEALLYHDDPPDTTIYRAVLNHEEQYSIWPAAKELPPGWRDAGNAGSKAEVLAFIEEVWVDMRPLSLRLAMDARKSDAG